MATGIGNQFSTPLAISVPGSANGKVKKKDKFDFYSFSLAGKSSFNSNLNNLKGDANLTLFSSSGSLIAESKKPKKQSEAINTTLEAGNYVMRVSLGKKTKKTSYAFNLAATPLTAPVPANTAPTLSGSLSLATPRNTINLNSVTLTNASLKAIDSQQAANQLTYTLTNLPKQGKLFKNGVELGAGGTFTQADIDGGLLAYRQESIKTLPNSADIQEFASSGSNAAWISGSGGNQTVYFYNGTTGTTQALTSTTADYDYIAISGENVVWGQYYSGGAELDLWYSTNGAAPIKINGSTNFDDTNPAISGTKIVFKRNDKSATNGVNDGIQLFDITTNTTTALSSTYDNDESPTIEGNLIAWQRYYSGTSEYDIRYSTGVGSSTINSSTTFSDTSPSISGTKILFKRNDNSGTNLTNDGIWIFDTATSSISQLRSGTEDVYAPKLSGSNAVWNRYFSGSEYDVQYSVNGGTYLSVNSSSTLSDYAYSISGTKIAFGRDDLSGSNIAADGIYLFDTTTSALVQLSSGSEAVYQPTMSGNNAFWYSNSNVFSYDGTTTADNFGFTVSDGTLTTNGTLNITIA